jgi:hypothetical protein
MRVPFPHAPQYPTLDSLKAHYAAVTSKGGPSTVSGPVDAPPRQVGRGVLTPPPPLCAGGLGCRAWVAPTAARGSPSPVPITAT